MPLLIKRPKSTDSPVKLFSPDMVDSYRGITLAWQDLNVYVPMQKGSVTSGVLVREKRHKPFKRVISNGKFSTVHLLLSYDYTSLELGYNLTFFKLCSFRDRVSRQFYGWVTFSSNLKQA